VTREIGLLTAEPSPLLLDQAALTGIGFVVLDAEQTALTPQSCATAVRQLAGCATRVCVRVPDLAPATLVTFANTGAAELVLPQVRSLADVEQAWRSVHYPPAGNRPRQPSPGSRYGSDWSRAPELSVIVETVEAVEVAEELAASPLVCGAWLGLTDLREDLARHGREGELDAAVEHVFTRFAAAGASLGLPAADAAAARAGFERGAARCLVYWETHLRGVLGSLSAATADEAVPA